MTLEGKYLYCLIPEGQDRPFNLEGLDSQGVHTIADGGLAAVVSDSPVKKYEASRENFLAHEKVIEAVMAGYPVLPVRFGTIAGPPSPEEAVRRLLHRRGQEFQELLRKVTGRVEMGVKALWREEATPFQEVLSQNPSLRQQRDALRARGGAISVAQARQLGEAVKIARERHRESLARRILAPLRPLSYQLQENPVYWDRMVLSAAFLVDKPRLPRWEEELSRLDQELGPRLLLKCVGPAPPFNFVNLVVSWEAL